MGNYWNGTGTYEVLQQKLHQLINEQLDDYGHVKGAKLERLRKMKGAYYGLFNNGDTGADTARYFDVTKDNLQIARRWLEVYKNWEGYDKHLFAATEPAMDAAILAAGVEQGLI